MGILPPTTATLRTGETITLRSALPTDASAVVVAAKRIFGQSDTVLTCADEFTYTPEEEAKILTTRAESPHGLFLLALSSNAALLTPESIIGIGGLDPMHRRRAMHNVGLGLMVDSAWHRKGVGDAIMKAMMDWARANPLLRRVQLEVIAANAHAVRLYERHGFVTEGRRKGVFQRQPGIFEDDLIMACDVAA